MSENNMRNKDIENDELRAEYDFSAGARGKHYQSYSKGTNLALLDPDVSKVFKDSESVNHALRMLLNLAGKEVTRNITRQIHTD